jgi:methylthioribose-1-phosphate isomerase
MSSKLEPIQWKENKCLLLDQRLIPSQKTYFIADDLDSTIYAIREMVVRGAPAIAISGAFGIVMEIGKLNLIPKQEILDEMFAKLLASRPTAVNLSRMILDFKNKIQEFILNKMDYPKFLLACENFAIGEQERDRLANEKIGQNALSLFAKSQLKLNILTHCNTGSLATAGHGTALGIIRSLRDAGFELTVYADETRPYLQGSRLTAFEMQEEGIECYIITDGMSAWLMNDRKIDAVIVGCDRIASNGDTANKIGTRGLAIIAKDANVPFYVAGTKDSFDFKIKSGSEIHIEMRDPKEVTNLSFLKDAEGKSFLGEGIIAPKDAKALNPSFDITPAKYITKIITEVGVWNPGEQKSIGP